MRSDVGTKRCPVDLATQRWRWLCPVEPEDCRGLKSEQRHSTSNNGNKVTQTHLPAEDKYKCRMEYKKCFVESIECLPVYSYLIHHREDSAVQRGK